MGHQGVDAGLGTSKKWNEVVELLSSDAELSDVAMAVFDASDRAFTKAGYDEGLKYVFWLMTQIPIAARHEDFPSGLRDIGIHVGKDPSIWEIIAAFNEKIEKQLRTWKMTTDIADMAMTAASESISSQVTEKTESLFGRSPDDIKKALASYSKSWQFSKLSRDFFARLTKHYLSYFLTRELTNHIGVNKRFDNLNEHEDFQSALKKHCREVSKIVQKFSNDWHRKHLPGGISQEEVSGFVSIALRKIKDEFKREGGND